MRGDVVVHCGVLIRHREFMMLFGPSQVKIINITATLHFLLSEHVQSAHFPFLKVLISPGYLRIYR